VASAKRAAAAAAVEDGPAVVQSLQTPIVHVEISVQKFSPSEFFAGVALHIGNSSFFLPPGLASGSNRSLVTSICYYSGTEVLGSGAAQGDRLGVNPIEIEITVDGSGVPLTVSDLSIPVTIYMNNTASAPGDSMELACVYWDESAHTWSQNGVQTIARPDENRLVCTSSHLSFFAAIWSSVRLGITCTNLAIFTENSFELLEGKHVPGVRRWYQHAAGIAATILFIGDMVLLVTACVVDQKHKKSHGWDDRNFFIEAQNKKNSTSIRERVTDAMINTIVLPNAAAQAKMVIEDFQAVAVVERIHEVEPLTNDTTRSVRTRASLHLKKGHVKLLDSHGQVVDDFKSTVARAVDGSRSLARIWGLFINLQPLLSAWRFSVMFTHFERLLFFSSSFWGALMASALYFNTSGGATSLEDPGECAAPAVPVVKAVVAGGMNTIISQLCTIIVPALKQRQFVVAEMWSEGAIQKRIRHWKILDTIVDIFLVSYLSFSILYVFLFLASVTDIDRSTWVFSAAILLINSWILTPVLTACILVALVNIHYLRNWEANAQNALDLRVFVSTSESAPDGNKLDKEKEQVDDSGQEVKNDEKKDEQACNIDKHVSYEDSLGIEKGDDLIMVVVTSKHKTHAEAPAAATEQGKEVFCEDTVSIRGQGTYEYLHEGAHPGTRVAAQVTAVSEQVDGEHTMPQSHDGGCSFSRHCMSLQQQCALPYKCRV